MSSNLNNLTIIVVEDDKDIREHVGAFLNRSGAKVVVARNGPEGLQAKKITIRIWFCSTLKCREWTVLDCCDKFELLELIPEAVYRLSL